MPLLSVLGEDYHLSSFPILPLLNPDSPQTCTHTSSGSIFLLLFVLPTMLGRLLPGKPVLTSSSHRHSFVFSPLPRCSERSCSLEFNFAFQKIQLSALSFCACICIAKEKPQTEKGGEVMGDSWTAEPCEDEQSKFFVSGTGTGDNYSSLVVSPVVCF